MKAERVKYMLIYDGLEGVYDTMGTYVKDGKIMISFESEGAISVEWELDARQIKELIDENNDHAKDT